jgi:hypothetical protein
MKISKESLGCEHKYQGNGDEWEIYKDLEIFLYMKEKLLCFNLSRKELIKNESQQYFSISGLPLLLSLSTLL